ncbi:MAG: hypothetical protein HYV42_00240 [Candidatus Magasanikbacteria bacterium]|nr:hypothetical protein [Candidatus Magasanikbacteria bacterium]
MYQPETTADRLPRRHYAEATELSAEAKEKQAEKTDKKFAARERMEQTSREIKNTKNLIQNIIANMQQVVAAVAAIRAQLGLSSGGAVPSVAGDEERLAQLRRKLDGLHSELRDLEQALLAEERRGIQEENPDWSAEQISQEANRRVQAIVQELGIAPAAVEAGGGDD